MNMVSDTELFLGGLILSAMIAHKITGKFIPKPPKKTGRTVIIREIATRREYIRVPIAKSMRITTTCPHCHKLIRV